jgi:hypothetical protein
MSDIRACLVCKHFSIVMAYEAYIDCDAPRTESNWPTGDPEPKPRALRQVAEGCRLFELHDDLRRESHLGSEWDSPAHVVRDFTR